METVALHTRLQAGCEAEYERIHATIPSELDALLRLHGITSWRIWRSGRDLFHVVECVNYAAFIAAVAEDPVNLAWQRRMSLLLEVVHDYRDPTRNALPRVWALP